MSKRSSLNGSLDAAPVTKRIRFICVPSDVEKELAKKAYNEILEQYQGQILPPHHPLTLYIRAIFFRLLQASNLGRLKDDNEMERGDYSYGAPAEEIQDPTYGGRAPKEWKLLVVNSNEMNAMAAFDTIIVYTGILPIASDEDTLAGVLAHEIGHVVARHHAETLSRNLLGFSVIVLASILTNAWLLVFYNWFGNLAGLPNSRRQESEADHIGLLIASRACFNPTGLANFQYRMAELEARQGRLPSAGFLDTHPPSAQRAKELEALIPKGLEIAAENGCGDLTSYRTGFDDALSSIFGRRRWGRVPLTVTYPNDRQGSIIIEVEDNGGRHV
ncbi:hypothetical protein M422DRAFT_68597 [Sphaerobolus stellatus SS14]|uniref:Peptidase M48 domain-containing protein n=1 Tax=Sphaerobolus stellatus (strain SS14) TaxID=990650 RepID=A0A0C9VFX3_SPHS4|nr:hypothetical protein M422DRAFT_68597 [Sphaerobolus stellatus SS14]